MKKIINSRRSKKVNSYFKHRNAPAVKGKAGLPAYTDYIKQQSGMEIYDMQYKILLFRAYEKYKRDWCASRGYSLTDIDEETEINGECYVCIREFENNEFQEAEYIQTLFSIDDFEIYKQVIARLNGM